MRVLVTGSNGMIARSVIAAYGDTADLWTTSRHDADGSQHVQADLANPVQTTTMLNVVQPQAVLHLAGSTGPSLSQLVESNVVATVNLMQAVPEGTHIVVAGSAAEYGTGSEALIGEDSLLRPVGQYGWSKVCQTESAVTIGERRGLATVIARPFNVVGHTLRQSTAFGNIRSQIRVVPRGGQISLTTGRLDITRDLVPIDFVADVLIAMTADITRKGVFNICTGQGFVLSEVVESMARCVGIDVALEVDPNLASIPASERIVGDPRKVHEIYGLRREPTIEDIARTILEPSQQSTGTGSAGVPSARPASQASQEQ